MASHAYKQVARYRNAEGFFLADAVYLEDQSPPARIYHPQLPDKQAALDPATAEPLLHTVMRQGELIGTLPDVQQASAYRSERLQLLAAEHQRFVNPHVYRVGISEELLVLRNRLLAEAKSGHSPTTGTW
jgi:nicotinate phosphoribosyltransferase